MAKKVSIERTQWLFGLIENDMVTNTIERRDTEEEKKRPFHAIDYISSIVDTHNRCDQKSRRKMSTDNSDSNRI